MRIIFYFLFLYLFLPFNQSADLITIFVFFILINENPIFSIFFAFLTGLLIDLYNPTALGFNTLIYLILGQGTIYLRRFIVREPLTLFIIFLIFYLSKTVISIIFLAHPFQIFKSVLTVIFFIPIYLLFSKLFFKLWIRS